MSELLFSYGTLRQRDVQRATFGREVDGYDDAIIDYHLEYVMITDPHVIATSGSNRHPILRPTNRPDAHVDGTVFTISEAELAAADDYEVDEYRRFPCRCDRDRGPGSTCSPVSVRRPAPRRKV